MDTKQGPVSQAVVERVVSDPALREVLRVTIEGARSVKEISDATGIPLSSAYRHIDVLLRDGLLIVDRSAISRDGKRYDLYRSRLRKVVLVLAHDGTRVTWEVDESVEDRLARLWQQMRL